MMGHREKMRGGDEYDALTPWKKYIGWRPGARKRIKRRFNKRARAQARKATEGERWQR